MSLRDNNYEHSISSATAESSNECKKAGYRKCKQNSTCLCDVSGHQCDDYLDSSVLTMVNSSLSITFHSLLTVLILTVLLKT